MANVPASDTAFVFVNCNTGKAGSPVKNIMFFTLQLLLALAVVASARAQSPSVDCAVPQALELVHGQPVTLDYSDGQRVMLAGDAEGNADLKGRSVVALEFNPSGRHLGYGVEGWAAQDVTSLLVAGSNSIRLVAVDPADRAWLVVTPDCDAVALATTPTRVLIPTATPMAVTVVDTPVSITGTVAANDTATASHALMRRAGRVLLATTLLGVLLLLTLGDTQRWWQGIRQLGRRYRHHDWMAMTAFWTAWDAWWHAPAWQAQRLRLQALVASVVARLRAWWQQRG